MAGTMKNILIAGIGNTLRGDDGFGVEVAKQLSSECHLPAGTKVIELGIAGISLVQELMTECYDALIVLDVAHRGGKPGTMYTLEAQVPEISSFSQEELRAMMTEPHTTEPSKAFVIAKALNVLPPKVFLVACEPKNVDDLLTELSEPVQQAAENAVERVYDLCKMLSTEIAMMDK